MAQDRLRGGAGPTPSEEPGHRPSSGRSGSPPASEGWTVLSHLLTGFLVFGLAGWGVDQLFDTRWFLLAGLLLGGAASFALIYIRYLYIPTEPLPRPGGPAGPVDRKEQHG